MIQLLEIHRFVKYKEIWDIDFLVVYLLARETSRYSVFASFIGKKQFLGIVVKGHRERNIKNTSEII